MLRNAQILLTIVAVLLLASATSFADGNYVPPASDSKTITVPGQVIVHIKPGVLPTTLERLEPSKASTGVASIDALLQKYSIDSMEKVFWGSKTPAAGSNDVDLTGFYIMRFPTAVDVQAVMNDFGYDENAIYAEPVYIWPERAVSNDPSDSLQYWLHDGTHGMKAYTAWDTQAGDSSILFGDIDSGVNYRHPDLANNIWVNPGEDVNHNGVVFDSADINGVDDDLDGKVDDLVGWDFLTSPGSPCWPGEDCDGIEDNNPSDFNGHGTFIAGLVAMVTNNAQGGAGIAGGWQPKNPGVRIMCLRSGYLASDGLGYNNSYASSQATYYAVTKGVDVINYSFGPGYPGSCTPGYGYYSTFANAVKSATNNGVYVTLAAGNDGVDCPDYMDTVAAVMSVAAVNSNDIKASWSNYGTWIDLSAAGVQCFSTSSDLGVIGYNSYDGTSFSGPVVAGVAALLKSQQPTLTRQNLDTLIKNHAENIDAYNPSFVGKLGVGRPNLDASMRVLPDANFTGGYVAGNVPLVTTFADASPNVPHVWQWDFGDGQTSTDQNPPPVTYSTPGLYNVSLTVSEPRGTNTHIKRKSILAAADTAWVEPVFIPAVTDTVEVPIYLTNSISLSEIQIPVTWKGGNISGATLLNTVVTAGTRCAYFEQAVLVNIYNGGKVATFNLKADNGGGSAPLPPGRGMICKLLFSVSSPMNGQKTCLRDTTYSSFTQNLVHSYFNYAAKFNSGCVTVGSPCNTCGDVDGSGTINVTDVVMLISYVFTGLPIPGDCGYPQGLGDADGNLVVNVTDVVVLIGYVFNGTPVPHCNGM